ncbi:LacI family DNA-binding transcriptional regulator [Culicoidibacter larvae]|uniref:LacI family transcriptional regulator n=1 Tax=Culicoidibacter larvae TaxID=2579976 RepID=A0A5R8QEN2_9FIRM|nr:LacI family DNA-binding transcriptional regulator [Culicoidibacter larvae]TLG75402.1 LacI family transcriptional regulator [Culicoidibacter larvae]
MASIKDIAKKAGVSVTAVSYALNGSKKVSEATRARIMAIAEELEYTPNLVGRSLQKQQTNIVAVFLTDYVGSFYGRLLAGIKEKLEVEGYELIVCSGSKAHAFLPQKLVDGAIILDSTFSGKELLKYADAGHKLVVLDRELEHENISNILVDNEFGATAAIEELIENNVDKIIVIEGPKSSFSSKIRRDVAANTAAAHQIEFEVLPGDYTLNAGIEHSEYIYQQTKNKKVGVFCLNDNMALGLYLGFKDYKDFVIGEDIQIIGFDATLEGQLAYPPLSTIYFSQSEWGAMAAEALLSMFDGQACEHRTLATRLLLGGSTQNSI